LPRELLKNYKTKPKEETERIREEIRKLRKEKMRESVVIKQEEKKAEVEQKEQEWKATSHKQLSKNATQKITLLGLRNISYKDLDKMKKDTFDPKVLIAEDDNDDEEYKQIMKKFEIIKEETPEKAQGPLTSRAAHKSIQQISRKGNSNSVDQSITSLKTSQIKMLR
jgi:hypothetical protein